MSLYYCRNWWASWWFSVAPSTGTCLSPSCMASQRTKHSDSWSMLQKQDGIIKCQVRYLPSWENQETYLIPGYWWKPIRSGRGTRELISFQKIAPADFHQKRKIVASCNTIILPRSLRAPAKSSSNLPSTPFHLDWTPWGLSYLLTGSLYPFLWQIFNPFLLLVSPPNPYSWRRVLTNHHS